MTITQFRQNMFTVVEQAINGMEVHVTHKGRGFTIKPDAAPEGRLSRIKPLQMIRGSLEGANDQLLGEMTKEWERDWAEL